MKTETKQRQPRNNTIVEAQIAAINQVASIVHRNAIDKGFHPLDDPEYVAKTTANMHGEVSEFWEAHRHKKLFDLCDKACGLTCGEEELADIVIRAFDTARTLNINIGRAIALKHEYNTTRPFRHGNKAA